MASMRRLNRRVLRWRRYADRTCWSPRVTRPSWMGPDGAITPGHHRAFVRLDLERERRLDVAARRYRTAFGDDEPRCTLTAGSACYCTSRPGCQMQHDEDTDFDDDGFDDDCWDPWPPIVTVDTGGLT